MVKSEPRALLPSSRLIVAQVCGSSHPPRGTDKDNQNPSLACGKTERQQQASEATGAEARQQETKRQDTRMSFSLVVPALLNPRPRALRERLSSESPGQRLCSLRVVHLSTSRRHHGADQARNHRAADLVNDNERQKEPLGGQRHRDERAVPDRRLDDGERFGPRPYYGHTKRHASCSVLVVTNLECHTYACVRLIGHNNGDSRWVCDTQTIMKARL